MGYATPTRGTGARMSKGKRRTATASKGNMIRIQRKHLFDSNDNARRELLALMDELLSADKDGNDIELTSRKWDILRYVCNRFGSGDTRHAFDDDFDSLFSEQELDDAEEKEEGKV